MSEWELLKISYPRTFASARKYAEHLNQGYWEDHQPSPDVWEFKAFPDSQANGKVFKRKRNYE